MMQGSSKHKGSGMETDPQPRTMSCRPGHEDPDPGFGLGKVAGEWPDLTFVGGSHWLPCEEQIRRESGGSRETKLTKV